jgi:hypothetical protein
MAANDSTGLMMNSSAPYSASKGRRFAITLGAAFGAIAAVAVWRDRETLSLVAGVVAALMLLSAVVAPARLEPVERAWMGLARAISRVTTPIFMGIVYFVVLTPAGYIRRTLGRNPLVHQAEKGTYWVARPVREGEAARHRMERQF